MGIEWTAAWAAGAGTLIFGTAWLALWRTEKRDLAQRERIALLEESVRVAEKYIDDRFFHTYRMEIMRLQDDYSL